MQTVSVIHDTFRPRKLLQYITGTKGSAVLLRLPQFGQRGLGLGRERGAPGAAEFDVIGRDDDVRRPAHAIADNPVAVRVLAVDAALEMRRKVIDILLDALPHLVRPFHRFFVGHRVFPFITVSTTNRA